MKLDFWINNEGRDEVHTVGYFGWVWHEGDTLRAGPGPRFGNDDPEGRIVGRMAKGLWHTIEFAQRAFTDFDIQLAKPPENEG
jgi:hypothetical protein